MNMPQIIRPALVASLVALPLAGCSTGASQFNPAAAPVATFQQHGAPLASRSSANAVKMQPDDIDPTFVTMVGSCAVYKIYQGDGVWEYLYEPPGCDPAEGADTGIGYAASAKDFLVGEVDASGAYVIAVENKKWNQVGTLTGLSGDPIGIAVDSSSNVWATNYPSNTISEFSAGSSHQTNYEDPYLSSISYIAVDSKNTMYWSGQSAKTGALEVDQMTPDGTITPIKTIKGGVAGGIAFAKNGKTLWVCDEGNGTSGTISGYATQGFARRKHFVYSGNDTGIAVAPSGNEVYAIDNVADGSEFDVTGVIYNAQTGKVVSTSSTITTSMKAVGISLPK